MDASGTTESSPEDLSSSPSNQEATWLLPAHVPKKKRTPAPPGAVSKGYLEYAGRRARLRPRIPATALFNLCNLTMPPESHGPSCSPSSDGYRTLETNSPVTSRLETPPTLEELSLDYSSSDLDVFEPESTSQPTRFHSLPPEVRILIFKEVLRVEEVEQPIPAVDIPTFDRVYPTFVNISQRKRDNQKDSVLNLLLVCRSFNSEAMPLFYEINLLRVSSPAMLYSFLKDLSRSRRRQIRSLRIGGIGFHYSGWQIMGKAISMLSLCDKLEHLELELAWEENSPDVGQVAFSTWQRALEGHFKIPASKDPGPIAAIIEGIQCGTVCLKSLRGLKSVHFHMVGHNNPLLGDEELSHWIDSDAIKQTASSWAIKIRSIVTCNRE